jgi:cell division protease FtsH
MNEAAIVTARENRTQITQHDVLMSVEKVIMGPERKSNVYIQKDRNIVAYHEAGHAIVASALEYADPVHKITIIPRGNAGGYTMSLPLEERRFTSKSEYIDELAVMFGGRAAEKIMFNEITGGAESDIQTATNIARAMVTKWGMSESLGPVAYASGRSMIHGEDTSAKEYSGDIAKKIDEEVSSLIQNALKRAEEILARYKDVLEAVAQKLLEVETLEQDEYNKLIAKFGIHPKTLNA